jgi:hypothetical protein
MSKTDPETTEQAARKSKRSVTLGDLLRRAGYGDLVDSLKAFESAGSFSDLALDLARAEVKAATRLSVPDGGNLANIPREVARTADKVEKIEEHLQKISRGLEAQNKRAVTIAGEVEGKASLPGWFPKKAATLKRWKEAFSVIVELRRTYREEYGSWEREDPNPKLTDYVDAIADETRWRPSTKTAGRIARAGDNGWLE